MGVWGWEWESELSDTKTWCYAISTAKRYQFQLYICFWYRYHCGVSERKLNECEREAHGIEFIFFLLLTFHWIFFLPRFKFAQFVLLLQSHSTQLRLNVSLGKKKMTSRTFPMIQQLFPGHQIWQSQSSSYWLASDRLEAVKMPKKNSHTRWVWFLLEIWIDFFMLVQSLSDWCLILGSVARQEKHRESVFDDEITTLNKVLIRFQWHILIKVSAESEKITTQ